MKNKKNTLKTASRVLKYLGRYKFLMLLSFLLAAASVAMTLYVPILIGDVIDCMTFGFDVRVILPYLLKITVLVLLTALAQLYSDVPPFRITGILDEPTARALVWFQERAGLPQSGELDKLTWRHLAHEYRQTIGDGSGSFPIRIAQAPESPNETQTRGM